MNSEELQLRGYILTEAEIKKNTALMVKQYRIALNSTRDDLAIAYTRYLSGVDPIDYYQTLSQFNRLKKLEQSIVKSYNDLARKTGNIIESTQRLAVSNNYYRQEYAHTSFIKYPFTRIHPAIIEMSVYGNMDLYTKIKNEYSAKIASGFVPAPGVTLSKILVNNNTVALNKILQTVTQGLIRGDSYRRLTKQIKPVFDNNAYNALRVMRTEGNRNLNAGNYSAWLDAKAEGVEGGRAWAATLDVRTRRQSGGMDGQREDKNGLFHYGGASTQVPGGFGIARYDIHDRCTTYVILDGIDPKLRRVRDPVTGETELASYKNFDEWKTEHGLKTNKFGEII